MTSAMHDMSTPFPPGAYSAPFASVSIAHVAAATSACRTAALLVCMTSFHLRMKGLRSVLDPFTPSAGLLC